MIGRPVVALAIVVTVGVAVAWLIGLLPVTSNPAQQPTTPMSQSIGEHQTEPLTLNTSTGMHVIQVEIARTPQQQALGLMYRTDLPRDRGMLFIHDRARVVTMWMKNTYIPLDMVFIRSDGTVHHIARETEPHSEAMISSKGPVAAVLEIGGGEAERYGLEPGDRVDHPVFQSP